ncbi:MAG TPA: AAA family ATPase [Hyphomicrobiaceae bacterium]|nr:AAA family ATPase [Hyphomicrobiaceae bacterium]
MDPVRNPFAPGAGNPPPELAGRGDILLRADIMLKRVAQGRHAKSFMLVGLRGVGKTVLLNRIREMAEEHKLRAHLVESPEEKPLPELLLPPLRRLVLRLDEVGRMHAAVRRGLRVLASFAKSVKVKHEGFEVSLDIEHGVADSGDLESDLADVLVAVGEAAKARKTAVVLLIDELQYVREVEVSALVMGIHKVSQLQLPLVLVGAGLPQLVGNMGRSKSYAERLFDFPELGPLAHDDAVVALTEPIAREGEKIEPKAVERIVSRTGGYPFFLQAWGYHCWNIAPKSPIRVKDVEAADPVVLADLDASFFRVRFDRLTPTEKRYLRAMAELGPGPHRSGEIADVLGVKVQSVAPTRNSLIKKGMIYSPAHGDTGFTVPLFDDFLKRQMPEFGSS